MNFRIIGADHTGITVSNLERSLEFWQNVLGFEFSHRAHQTGEMVEQITGVKGAELKLREKLENRNCLLVIDDVWQRARLDSFLQGGKKPVLD